MKVLVTAVPGSGKTTVINLVKKKVSGLKVVNVGDLIFDIAKRKMKVKDRDELRVKMSLKQQQVFQEMAAKKVSRMRAKRLVIDTHASIRTPQGYFPGLSEKVAKIIKPDVIVCLDMRPEEIISHRNSDKSRRRDGENMEQIELDQKSDIEFAYEAASHAEAAVQVIDLRYPETEPFAHAKKAADEIVKLFKKQGKL